MPKAVLFVCFADGGVFRTSEAQRGLGEACFKTFLMWGEGMCIFYYIRLS